MSITQAGGYNRINLRDGGESRSKELSCQEPLYLTARHYLKLYMARREVVVGLSSQFIKATKLNKLLPPY